MNYKLLPYVFLIIAVIYACFCGSNNRHFSKHECGLSFVSTAKGLRLSSAYAPLYTRILLGCDYSGSRISRDLKSVFVKTNTVHLLSISGLHVGLIIASVYIFLNIIIYGFIVLLKKEEFVFFPYSLLAALVFSAMYVFGIGAEVPRLRALIMAWLAAISIVFPVIRGKFAVLAFSAAVVLCILPESLYSISFYYSFMSVAGIYLSPKKDIFSICLYIYIFTLPLNLFLNGTISLMHVVSNIVVVPLFSLVFFPGLMFSSLLMHAGFYFQFAYLDALTTALLKMLGFFAVCGDFMGMETYRPGVARVLFLYFLIVFFYALVRYAKRLTLTYVRVAYACVLIFSAAFALYSLKSIAHS